MTYVRLTKQMREDIARAIVLNKYPEEKRKSFTKREYDLALKIYNHIFTEQERKLMQSLPKGWMYTASSTNIEFAGKWERLHFEKGMSLPYSMVHTCHAKFDARDKFTEEFRQLKDDIADFDKARKEATTKAMAVLNSVSTLGALENAWPEISSFLKPYKNAQKQVVQLPVPLINKLNQELDLPPEEKRA